MRYRKLNPDSAHNLTRSINPSARAAARPSHPPHAPRNPLKCANLVVWFESVAQLVEHRPFKALVLGSSPSALTISPIKYLILLPIQALFSRVSATREPRMLVCPEPALLRRTPQEIGHCTAAR